MDLGELIARTEPLLGQARAKLELQSKHNPENVRVLYQLADIVRAQGDLNQSARLYEQVLQKDPENLMARQRLAVLSPKLFHAEQQPDSIACPFVLNQSFLDPDELESVWKLVISRQSMFGQSRVYNSEKLTDIRYSNVLYEQQLQGLLPWFLDKVETKLRESFQQLGLDSFDPAKKEIQLTAHKDGGFYNVHSDKVENSPSRSRVVTYVYYFHSQPKQFCGGDLLLYDRCAEKQVHSWWYTRLVSQHNVLLFFPSSFYHQVTPVRQKAPRFLDSRFTINGWFHRTVHD